MEREVRGRREERGVWREERRGKSDEGRDEGGGTIVEGRGKPEGKGGGRRDCKERRWIA